MRLCVIKLAMCIFTGHDIVICVTILHVFSIRNNCKTTITFTRHNGRVELNTFPTTIIVRELKLERDLCHIRRVMPLMGAIESATYTDAVSGRNLRIFNQEDTSLKLRGKYRQCITVRMWFEI